MIKSSVSKNIELYPPKHLITPEIPVFHGFFGRHGGMSTGIYEGLNCGFGDDGRENVLENRRRVVACYGQPLKNLMLPKQVHGGHAVIVDEVIDNVQADAFVTSKRNIVLGVQTADCLPILMYAENGVIAAVHGGWRSLTGDIIEHAVKKMIKLGASRSGIRAAIGPCAQQTSYEVRQDFYDHFCKISPENEIFFISTTSSEPVYFFDLVHYAQKKLSKAEIEVVINTGQDTYTQPDTYFSRRHSLHNGHTGYGAQLSVIVLS